MVLLYGFGYNENKNVCNCQSTSITAPIEVHVEESEKENILEVFPSYWSCSVTIAESTKRKKCVQFSNHFVEGLKEVHRNVRSVAVYDDGFILLEEDNTLRNADGRALLCDKCAKSLTSLNIHKICCTNFGIYCVADTGCIHAIKHQPRDGKGTCTVCKFSTPTLLTLTIKVKVTDISCGKEHVIIMTEEGEVLVHGTGSRGQLGNGRTDSIKTPYLVDSLEGIRIIKVSAGGWHSIVLTDTGDVYVWGWNEAGQLGLPNSSNQSPTNRPTTKHDIESQRPELSHKKSVTTESVNSKTYSDSCCQQKSVSLSYNMLDPQERQIIIQEVDPVQVLCEPLPLDLPFNIVDISCGSRHSGMVEENGLVLTCGFNEYGQLGHGDKSNRDYLEIVHDLFIKGQRSQRIWCGAWNTFVLTTTNLSKSALL